MYCTQCGSFLPEGAKFCPSCGAERNVRIRSRAPQNQENYGAAGNPSPAPGQESYQDPYAGYEEQKNTGKKTFSFGQSDSYQPQKKERNLDAALMQKILMVFCLVTGAATIITAITALFGSFSFFGRWFYGFSRAGMMVFMRMLFSLLLVCGKLIMGSGLIMAGLNTKKKQAPLLTLMVAAGFVMSIVAIIPMLSIEEYLYGSGNGMGGDFVRSAVIVLAFFVLMGLSGMELFTDYRAYGLNGLMNGYGELFADCLGTVNKLIENNKQKKPAAAERFAEENLAEESTASKLDEVYRKAETEQNRFDQSAFNQDAINQDTFQQNSFDQNPSGQHMFDQTASHQTGFGQNAYGLSPAPFQGKRLNDRRGLIWYILLNWITGGFYSLYWTYAIARDVNIVCMGDGEKNIAGLLKFLLFSILTCGIYALYWEYRIVERLRQNAPRYGQNIEDTGMSILLWNVLGLFLFGIGPLVAMHKLCKAANLVCEAYNQCHGVF